MSAPRWTVTSEEQQQRQQLDQKMSTPEGGAQQDRDLQLQLPLEPFTLVIELDAWNIRKRDGWARAMRCAHKIRSSSAGIRPTAAPVFV
jgi:hypothetical protein